MLPTRALTVLIVLLAAVPVGAQPVERVIDGDTIVVAGVGTVRLIGVDTPETVDPRKPVEYFGREAAAFLRKLVAGQTVRLEYDWQRKDRYNRTLAYVYLADGTFVNAEIVRQGYGHAYTQFPFKHLEEFRRLQAEARAQNRGLWAPDAQPAAGQRATDEPNEAKGAATVYVTRTGTKYHRDGCRYLARSQIPMPLKDAAARYGPCSVCRPPVVRGSSDGVSAPAPRRAPAATPGRCQAITRAGAQCKRRAQAGSRYCWQHAR